MCLRTFLVLRLPQLLPHPDISSSGSTVSQRHRSLETLFYAQVSSRAMSSLSRAPSPYVQYLHASLPKPSSSFPAPQPQAGSPKQEGLYAKAGNRKKADPDRGPVYLPANPSHQRHSTIYCGGIRLGSTIIANWRSMSGYGTLALSKVCSTKVPTGPYLPHISSHSSGD